MAFRVCAIKADTSEARKFSPLPRPTTSGEFRRAATTKSGLSALTTTKVNAPVSDWHTWRSASPKSGVDLTCLANKCATTSESVWLRKVTPSAINLSRRTAKFSIIPL